jgi:hypothetical protein
VAPGAVVGFVEAAAFKDDSNVAEYFAQYSTT